LKDCEDEFSAVFDKRKESELQWLLNSNQINEDSLQLTETLKVKQSLYTPWRRLVGEEVYLLLIHDLGTRWG
jgi:hypothetical protein